MKQEEHKQKLNDILANAGDPAKISALLTELSDDYGVTVTAVNERAKTAEQKAAELVTKNTELADTNMRLFLKLGEQVPAETKPGQEQPTIKIADLFNENGELK